MNGDEAYFVHKTTGSLEFDPKIGTKHYEPWWALLRADEPTIDFYAWLLKRGHGIEVVTHQLWGSHISVVKGQEPSFKDQWGKNQGKEVEYWYTNQVRWDNMKHAWLDVFSPQMSDIREEMGLPPKCFFHLTIGRLK
jgi:hypothetical protein